MCLKPLPVHNIECCLFSFGMKSRFYLPPLLYLQPATLSICRGEKHVPRILIFQIFMKNLMFSRLYLNCLLFIIIFYLFWRWRKNDKMVESEQTEIPVLHIKSYKKCINSTRIFKTAMEKQQSGLENIWKGKLNEIDDLLIWETMEQKFNKIWSKTKNLLSINSILADEDEYKYFLPFSTKLPRPYNCNIVTFGIGQTVKVEKTLKEFYPECLFLGIDPSAEINEDLYKTIDGEFVQAAIGAETIPNQNVFIWGKFDWEKRNHIGIVDFLKSKFTNGKIIDMASIDVEGAEFDILQKINDELDYFSSTICQMNIEFHHPERVYTSFMLDSFAKEFDKFIKTGHFALINVDSFRIPEGHLYLRFFLVNVFEKKCLEKFLC